MKKLIISENERNNILNKYYTKFRLNEQDYFSQDTPPNPVPAATTPNPQTQENITIQKLQELLGFKGDAVDGKAGPNTLAAIENALKSKGALPPATGGAANTQTPQKTTTGTQQQVNVGQSSYAFTPSALQSTNATAGAPQGVQTPQGAQKTTNTTAGAPQAAPQQSEIGDDPAA